MRLQRWSFQSQYGFTLRGQHSVPSGKPVLHMLHGNGFSSLTYQPLLQRLVPYFDLFLSDVQGHGDSDHGGQFIGWHASAELALQAWQAHASQFGAVQVYGLGHSFGGVLTALINSQPQRPFDRVILLDPVLFPPLLLQSMRLLDKLGWYQRNPMAKKAQNRRQHWPDPAAAANYLHNRGMFKGWHPAALQAYIDHGLTEKADGIGLKCQPSREAEIFASYPAQLWQHLRQPCSPTLVVYGEQTYPFVPKAVRRWQQQNHNIAAKAVPGGHCFMQQDPSATAQLILHHWQLPSIETLSSPSQSLPK